MKKRLLSIILTLCMVLSLMLGFAQPTMAAGEGTGNPLDGAFALNTSGVNMIYNADQLAYVAYQINNNIPDWRTASYKIMNNIDLSSYSNWEPIGIGGAAVNWPEFKGTFDGGGYTISNLRQVRDDGDFGLFGTISNWQAPGVVRNIALTNVVITATNINSNTAIGAIAGYNKGTIENCSVAGTISATSNNGDVWVGGITGRHWTTVRNCYSTANVLVAGNAGDCSGGIVGQTMGGEVTNCYFTGSVGLNLNSVKVGAIVGDNYGAASNCYWLSSSASVGVNQNVLFPGTASNISSFAGNTLASQVTIGGTSYSSLLGALNARVNELASTNLKTWTSSGSYPVFSTVWTPPTYTATVAVNKDGSAWTSGTPNIKLSTSSSSLTGAISGTLSNGVYTFSGLANDTSYYLWEDEATDSYTGQSVAEASSTVTLNYYTVTFRNDDNTSTLYTQTVLSGQHAVYGGATPTKTSTAQYSYAFSKWVTTAGGAAEATLTNIMAAKTVYASFTPTLLSYTITWKKDGSTTIDTTTVAYGEMPTHSVPTNTGYTFAGWTPTITSVTGAATYTATWTLDTYSINYTLNGGIATNPPVYQYTTGTFTLNNPTREGYTFVGWTGSNGGAAQTSITVAQGSTGNKTYTANWKADTPATAPATSIVTAKTDTSLTITMQAGYEYSVDNGAHWYSGTGSYTFTDLSPNTPHNLVCRKAAVTTGDISAASDASDPLSVTTKMASASVPTPTAPEIGVGADKPTSNSITVSTSAGNEYYISASDTAPATWPTSGTAYFKATGTDVHTFTGLTAGTQYYIHVRVAETDTAMPSASACVMQYTLPVTPEISALTINYAAETISFANTYEVSASDEFNPTVLSGGSITPGATYYVRVKSAGGVPASEAVSIATEARPATPAAITAADITRTNVTITILNTVSTQEYSVDCGMTWQTGNNSSLTFNALIANHAYNVVTRIPAKATAFASSSTAALSVTTKAASASVSVPDAPTIGTGANKPTSGNITISTTAGCEYYISTSATAPVTWPTSGDDYFKDTDTDIHTFTGLTAGTQYYIHVRVAETDTAMPSASACVTQYTLPVTPQASVVAINYADETISFTNTYEVSASADFSQTIASGVTITPGTTYYVRVKSAGGVPASEAVSFTVVAKPDVPSTAAYSYNYHNEQIIFASQYEVFTATYGSSAVISDSTAIIPGGTLYIRVKATSSAPASGWTTITIPDRPTATGLSLAANRTDTTITMAAITGAEYSKDGGTTWQSSNEFAGLNTNTDYAVNIRYAATDTSFASSPLGSVTFKTKTAPGAALSAPSVSTQTYNAIIIEAIAGCQYAITTGSTAPTTWDAAETANGTKIFSGLSAATPYYIWVRAAETDTAMPSNPGSISVYTAAVVPLAGEGYTIDYSAETISIANGYEVSANNDFGTTLPSGASLTPGTTYYVRKAVDTTTTPNTPASAAVSLTLPQRPETPAATGNAETVDGKNDGKISGVTAAMEWKATGGTYTAVTAAQALNGITGLTDGTYSVRYMAVSGTGFKSAEQEITIAAGHTITVTFNSQSGSDVAGITGKAYGDSVTAPAAPTRAGFYFAGWYKEASCTNVWTFTFDTLADNITLFAKWSAIPTYTVTGRIVDDASHAVEGATVRIMQGATQYGTTGVTDTNGDFAIDNVPPGTYNLVITQGTKTVVIKVKVSSGNVAIGNAVLPAGNANCVLVVNGSNTPSIVVGGLDSEAGAQLADSGDPHTDNIKITLTVEKKDTATATNGSAVAGSVTAAGKQVGMILDIDVSKTVNGTEDTSYSQTNEMIEIIIPLPAELQGKATYAVYRHHGASVDAITETANTDGERIVIDRTNWTITLYAKKFSTYAIGYTNPISGGGGGSSTSYTITASAGETAALPYYIENGKEIFIGFASDASGTMKYIAPEGAKVLFRENPKSFSDIEGHWARGNIDFVTERELFLGTGDSNFSPQSGMTRAMFATVIGRLYERSYGKLFQKDHHAFTDVDYDAYYGAYIDWASENNIITGIGGGLFKPDREISRQEMAVILYRFAKFLNALPSDLEKTQLDYPDAADISSWATEAAMYCKQTGIITGRSGGYFAPQGTATRAEVAAIMQRFIESSVKLLNDLDM